MSDTAASSQERPPPMAFVKIDCVMIPVDDLDAAVQSYREAFGLSEKWRDEASVGLAMPQTDAEVVLHTLPIPRECSVHYLVRDARAEPPAGFTVVTPPFRVAIGWCAVLCDPWGNAVCVLDMSTGARI